MMAPNCLGTLGLLEVSNSSQIVSRCFANVLQLRCRLGPSVDQISTLAMSGLPLMAGSEELSLAEELECDS